MRGNKMVNNKIGDMQCALSLHTLNVQILDIGSNNSRPEQQNQTYIF